MGNKNPNVKLFKAIKNNENQLVDKYLNEKPQCINDLIDPEGKLTPIQVAAFYNAFECTKPIIKHKPVIEVEYGNLNAYFIACAKDNIYIVRDLWAYQSLNVEELNGDTGDYAYNFINQGINSNEENDVIQDPVSRVSSEVDLKQFLKLKLNPLDYAVLNMSYRCALFLNNDCNIKLKNLDFYLTLRDPKKTGFYNFSLMLECISNKIPRDKTPSFYIKKKVNKNIDDHLPDPNESWKSFAKRMMNFELYQPPLVPRDSVPIEKRKSMYMKMQTKFLEYHFNKKSSFF